MNIFERINKKGLASGKLGWEIVGALFEWRPKFFLAFLLLITPISVGLSYILSPDNWKSCVFLLCLNLIVWLIIKVCNTLSALFSLNKKEAGITWCQISILAALGLWIIGFILIFNIQKDARTATVFGVIGSVTGWIFQDKLKGVVAFIHLRLHHLLNIGDWISVPKYNIDGEVRAVTLTTVTFLNWDTTTSTIPISTFSSDHFINCQHMAEGKTYGRRMVKNLLIDTGTFHQLTADEAKNLLSDEFNAAHDVRSFIPAEEIKEGALNAHLYRLYLYHWLMHNPHVSHLPSHIVNWKEHKQEGMPLQIYTFLLDSKFVAYEWQQSLILEHAVEALGWFGLRLYQAPSSTDVQSINKEVTK